MKKLLIMSIISSSLLFGENLITYDKVKVISSSPIKKTVSVKVPYQECYQQRYTERVPVQRDNNVDRNSIGLDTIIGTTLGVVVGNQIGKGNGKTAAKIIGGIGGGYAANQMRGGEVEYTTTEKTRQVCDDKIRYESKDIISGYKNTFKLNNQYYTKTSDMPLEHVTIKKTISF